MASNCSGVEIGSVVYRYHSTPASPSGGSGSHTRSTLMVTVRGGLVLYVRTSFGRLSETVAAATDSFASRFERAGKIFATRGFFLGLRRVRGTSRSIVAETLART